MKFWLYRINSTPYYNLKSTWNNGWTTLEKNLSRPGQNIWWRMKIIIDLDLVFKTSNPCPAWRGGCLVPKFPARPWFGTVSRPCSRLSKLEKKSLSKLIKNRDSINLWSYSTSISHRKECKSEILIWTVNKLNVRNLWNRNLGNTYYFTI